jgi:hypothetical protein
MQDLQGITIDCRQNNVDLRQILALAGERALASRRLSSDVEAIGQEAADVLEQASQKRKALDGKELFQLLHEVWQVVDGDFEAFDADMDRPWLIVRAVDSTCFDVITGDPTLLEQLTTRFRNVVRLPSNCW